MERTVGKAEAMDNDSMEIRKRIEEVLELISSEGAQVEYQRKVPSVSVSTEIFSQWEDWYHPGSSSFDAAFDDATLSALAEFNRVFEAVCDETPQLLPPLEELIRTPAWTRYRDGARQALALIRGKGARR